MEIKSVSIIGLGALGVMFGHKMSKHMEPGSLRIIADRDRIDRYTRDSIYSNDELCEFKYVSPDEKTAPADLLIFAVKFSGLRDAISSAKNHVGRNTVILSLLNGISSEEIIGASFGADKLLYSVAQGMDAVKVGNRLTYHHMGMICFGDMDSAELSEKAKAVASFFDRTGIPYQVFQDMRKRLWGKFMLNVGVNQVAAVFKCDYGGILRDGTARDTMIAAMKEVMLLSEKEGVDLTQSDLEYWLGVLDGLSPDGKPSMQQDLEAKRKSEVELFSGTILELGRKHDLVFPVNRMLYDRIKEMESEFV